MQQLESQLTEAKTEIESLNKQNAEAIAAMEQKQEENRKTIENHTKTIEDQAKTIEDQTATIDDQTKTIADQANTIARHKELAKQSEQKKHNYKKELEQLNDACAIFHNNAEDPLAYVLTHQDKSDHIKIIHSLLNSEGNFKGIHDDFIAKVIEAQRTAAYGFTVDEFSKFENSAQLYLAGIVRSGEKIRKAKPSDPSLKEAYDKLGNMHSSYQATILFVMKPSGTLKAYNSRMAKFREEWQLFESWWVREVSSQVN